MVTTVIPTVGGAVQRAKQFDVAKLEVLGHALFVVRFCIGGVPEWKIVEAQSS
ncbi:MAG: hypothetical protein WBR26_17005 [Candidatus Acidiferrum sp.]